MFVVLKVVIRVFLVGEKFIVVRRNCGFLLLIVGCAISQFVGAAIAADGPYAGATAVPQQYAAGFNSITEAESRQILTTLVEGEMAGRGTGQEG